ncbi:MAG: response regulator transcription factor, partial [Rubrobacter sp.]|nr:response regulator transcription factor [Rubrobacter sp.]
LYLSEFTIKQHLRRAYKLLGVKNRTEAANLFRKQA